MKFLVFALMLGLIWPATAQVLPGDPTNGPKGNARPEPVLGSTEAPEPFLLFFARGSDKLTAASEVTAAAAVKAARDLGVNNTGSNTAGAVSDETSAMVVSPKLNGVGCFVLICNSQGPAAMLRRDAAHKNLASRWPAEEEPRALGFVDSQARGYPRSNRSGGIESRGREIIAQMEAKMKPRRSGALSDNVPSCS